MSHFRQTAVFHKLLISAFLMLFSLPASADIIEDGNFKYSTNSNGTCTITGIADGYTPSGDLVIPERIPVDNPQYTVTKIGDKAFEGMSGFTGSLTIPNSVTSIGGSAFYSCSGLIGPLTIPNGVASIGSSAFYGCNGFTGPLNIPDGITKIGYETFYGCSGLTGPLTIPNGVTSIGSFAFSYCSGLTGPLNIPDGITKIEDGTFARCSGLTGTLTIPNSVTSIGQLAFNYCSGFTGPLKIPDGIEIIEGYVFEGCSGLTGPLTIPNGVTSIGRSAFSFCSGLTGPLTIPNGVTSIGYNAFNDCSGLTGPLTIPNGVTSIGSSAFSGCSGFTGPLNIPDGITKIENGTFSGCSGLTGPLTIPNGVTSIGSYAFRGCSGFTGTLTFGDHVSSIDNDAFYRCSGLNGTLTLPASLETLGNTPFDYCGFTEFVSLNTTPPGPINTSGTFTLFSNNNIQKAKLFVPAESVSAYEAAPGWEAMKPINAIAVACTSIKLDHETLEINPGLSQKISATISPDNATDKTVTWASSNPEIATVDDNGVVAGVSAGKVTITAKTVNDLTATCQVTVTPFLATAVTINVPAQTIYVGSLLTLTADVTPDNTTDKSIEWSSSAPTIATIDAQSGELTAIAPGEVTITAKCGEVTGTTTVTVQPVVATSISVSSQNLSLSVGSTDKLTATVSPDNTTDKTVSWSSDNELIATVSSDGTVTAVSVGTTTVTATCGAASATCQVTVSPVLATSVTINVPAQTIYVGSLLTLTADVTPDNTTDKTLEWSSSAPTIATIDAQSGELTAIAPGEVTITAKCGEVTGTTTVTVHPVLATSLILSSQSLSLSVGTGGKLTATVSPENTTDKTVSWSSDNEAVATVSADGMVTAESVGTATITATSGSVSATCTVTVAPWSDGKLQYDIIRGGGENGEDVVKVIGGEPNGDGTLEIPEKVEIDGKEYPVTEIGDGAFKGNTNIKKLVIPASIVKIGDEAFSGCTSLAEVIAEDGEKLLACGTDAFKNAPITTLYLGRNTSGKPFAGNTVLKELTVGDKVTAIGSGDFGGCTSITSVKSLAANPPTLPDDGFEEVVYTQATLSVREANKEDYKSAEGWKKFVVIIGIDEILPVEITLNQTEIELAEKATVTLQATVTPDDVTNKTVTWTTSDETIATVDAAGKVTGVKAGTATITATTVALSAEGKKLTASCEVTVIPKTETVGGIEYEIVTGGGENGEDVVKVIGGEPNGDGTLEIPEKVEIDGKEYPVTEIVGGAFKGNTNIKKLVIPASVVKIGDEAFSGCSSLADVIAEDGEKLLACGTNAFKNAPIATLYLGRNTSGKPFAGNTVLKDLTVGDKVTAIGSGDFTGCTGITSVKSLAANPPTLSDDGFEEVVYTQAILSVPEANKDDYQSADGWKNFFVIIGIDEILPVEITLNQTEIKLAEKATVTLQATVTPDDATNKTVTWTTSDETIATVDAAGKLTGVKAGTATITATTVAMSAEGKKLTASCEVTVVPKTETVGGIEYEIVTGGGENGEDVVKVIGGDSDGDGTLEIPEKVEIDGKEYPVTEIGDGAFKDNTDIRKLVIPASVVKIGDEAFSGCTSLAEVIAEDGEKLLACGADAFKNAPIATLYLGRNTSGRPFAGNTTLKELTVGDKVTAIGSGDFGGCTSITSVKSLAANPPTLPDDGFEEVVYTNATLRVPDTKVEDYKSADGWKKFFEILGINEIRPIDIELNQTEVELTEGETITLNYTITPDNATDKTVTWSSDTPEVASVDESGLVTAIKAGQAVIVVRTANGLEATCTVTVVAKAIPAESVTLSRQTAELKVNETLQLTATVTPENATDKTVVWESSDETVVTVSAEGLLTAIGVGEATVTAKCGDATAVCAVKVTATSGIFGIAVDDGKPLSVYNLQGIKLKVSTLEELNSLPKGFYIVNGKKVYIK